MKEATGELVSSVTVLVAIGILMASFYYVLWPVIKQGFENTTACNKAICEPCKDSSGKPSNKCDTVTCYRNGIKDDEHEVKCVYKG